MLRGVLSILRACVVLALTFPRVAAAQDEPGCRRAIASLEHGDPRGAERALAEHGPDELTACDLDAWGRVAEARRENIRASVFYRRALAAGPSEAAAPAIERREAVLPALARSVAEAVLEQAVPGRDVELPGVPTLALLCELVRAREELAYYDIATVRCDVVDRARGGGVQAALLRAHASRVASVESLLVAVRAVDGWRVLGEAGSVRAGGGEYGEMSGTMLVRQVIPGGPLEIETVVHRWQSERDFEECFTHRQREVHRQICAQRDREWECREWQTEARLGDSFVARSDCHPPPFSPPPAWSIELRFSEGSLEISGRGPIPSELRSQLGAHPLSEVFGR